MKGVEPEWRSREGGSWHLAGVGRHVGRAGGFPSLSWFFCLLSVPPRRHSSNWMDKEPLLRPLISVETGAAEATACLVLDRMDVDDLLSRKTFLPGREGEEREREGEEGVEDPPFSSAVARGRAASQIQIFL